MALENIEVMRLHRTKINQAAESASAPQPRPSHVYLLRYPDKGRILKAATNTLKDNPFHSVSTCMALENIEVMRPHRTKINQAAESASAPQPRPSHVYLLRYPDKGRILKAATNTLKDNPFFDSQIFISDDVSKAVRSERAKLRKGHLKQLKERGVQFAFIPWSVPAQILYKETDSESLKSFKIRHE